jgi:membrane protease YdiL (CAAX protease family)
MVEPYLTGFTFGLFGYLVADVLIQPGEILHPYQRLVSWLFRHERRNPADWNILQQWGFKALYGCAKCVAGFTCLLWLFLSDPQPPSVDGFFLFSQAITAAIFTGHVLNRLHESGRI